MRNDVMLPATALAPTLARLALDDAVPPPELDDRLQDARIAMTEVVTNALRHGGLTPGVDMIRLTITADDDLMRAEVEQAGSAREAHAVEPRPEDDAPGGFGLRIVEATADKWGVEPGPPGRVWFEFHLER